MFCQRSPRVASSVFNASDNALDAGDGTLGLLTWMLTSDANDLRRLPRLGELGMSAAARGRGLSAWMKSVLKCITPLNASYRSRTRLRARASRERIRLDSRSVQVLKVYIF